MTSRRLASRTRTGASLVLAVLAPAGCSALSESGAKLEAVAQLQLNPTLLVATTRKPVNGARCEAVVRPERASR